MPHAPGRARVSEPLAARAVAHDGVPVSVFFLGRARAILFRYLGEFRSAAGDEGLDHYLQIARVNLVASYGDEEVALQL